MRASHLRQLARQSAEHHGPGIRRVHLVTNVVGWLGLMTALSQVPLGPTNLGVALIVASVLYVAALDLLSAAIIGTLGAVWATFGVWGPGSGWIAGVIVPLAAFSGFGGIALAAHVYYHERGSFLANETKAQHLSGTLHVIAFGAFEFTLLALLDRGWRPKLRAELLAAERALCLRREHGTWSNWGQTATCRPAVTWLPETTDDVVTAVREAAATSRKVRVVASGFSWPSFVPTDDVLIFAERLDSLELERPEGGPPVLIAGAGATNRQINTFLSAHGLCLPWNVVLETVRIGGSVATGTHGSGQHTGTMGDLLEAIELVDATGTVRVFRAADDPAPFDAIRVSLGTFGVVTRMWLRVIPLVAMRQVDRRLPIATVLADLEAMVARHDAVELYWFPFCDWMWVRTLDRTDAAVTLRPLSSRWIQLENLVQMTCVRLGMRAMRRFAHGRIPAWIRFGAGWLRFREVVVPLPDAQHYRQWIESMRVGCVEVALPAEPGFAEVHAAWAALRERVDAWAAQGRYPLDLTVNVRFIGQSRALLSPASRYARTCWMEALCCERTPDWEVFAPELLDRWLDVPGALTHWAKEFERTPRVVERVRAGYGDRIPAFLARRAEADVDPNGMFVNPLLNRLLYGSA
jgi:hypothetical protein